MYFNSENQICVKVENPGSKDPIVTGVLSKKKFSPKLGDSFL